MTPLVIKIIPALQTNYIYLLYDKENEQTAVVDPSDPAPVLKELDRYGWTLTFILNTHHHWDHTDGNLALKDKTGCQIAGYAGDAHRIPGIDILLDDGDCFDFSGHIAKIMHIPGHTTGAIAWYFSADSCVFTGDTLFTLGCGRLFEGTPEQMYQSLASLSSLPADTCVYSGHEYAENNALFAITLEPNNKALQSCLKNIKARKNKKLPSQPSTIQDELATNPFLRLESPEIRQSLHMEEASCLEVLTEIRRRKDAF